MHSSPISCIPIQGLVFKTMWSSCLLPLHQLRFPFHRTAVDARKCYATGSRHSAKGYPHPGGRHLPGAHEGRWGGRAQGTGGWPQWQGRKVHHQEDRCRHLPGDVQAYNGGAVCHQRDLQCPAHHQESFQSGGRPIQGDQDRGFRTWSGRWRGWIPSMLHRGDQWRDWRTRYGFHRCASTGLSALAFKWPARRPLL